MLLYKIIFLIKGSMQRERDRLFDLVKSLDKNEKGYFKKQLFNKVAGSDRYFMILFDAISAQSVYDEAAIRLKIKDKDLLKNFGVHKTYLYEVIMKMLTSYHAKTSVKSELKTSVRNAEILILKALYNDARQTLLKALEQAQNHEFFTLTIEIYDLLLKIDQHMVQSGEYTEEQSEILIQNRKELLNNIHKYTNFLEYWDILIKYHQIILGKEILMARREKLEQLIDGSLLNDEKNALSLTARLRHYNTNGLIHINYLNNPQIAINLFKKVYELFESFPKTQLKDDMRIFMGVLNNLMYSANLLKDADTFNKAFNKMNELSVKHKVYKLFISTFTTVNKLYYFIRHHKLKEGLAYIKLIEKKSEDKQFPLPYIMIMISIYKSIIYFMSNQPQIASSYLRKLFNVDPAKNMDEEVMCFSLYLWLIVEFELNNFEFLDHLLKTVERKIKNLHCDTFIVQECVRFFKRVNHQTDKSILKEAYKKLEQSIRQYPHFISDEVYLFSVADWAKKQLTSN